MPGTILSARYTAEKKGKERTMKIMPRDVYILVETVYEQNKKETKKWKNR